MFVDFHGRNLRMLWSSEIEVWSIGAFLMAEEIRESFQAGFPRGRMELEGGKRERALRKECWVLKCLKGKVLWVIGDMWEKA